MTQDNPVLTAIHLIAQDPTVGTQQLGLGLMSHRWREQTLITWNRQEAVP